MKSRTLNFAVLVLLSFCGCAHTDNSLENKVAAEEKVENVQDLKSKVDRYITDAPDLTPSQKEQLRVLFQNAREQVSSNEQESLKLRSILIKEILSEDYSQKEVGLIKRKLSKLQRNSLTTMFNTIEKANRIMGRTARNHQQLMDETFYNYYTQ